jgi:SRSO17 transposase
LFGDAERKSVEPIAARACADPKKTDAVHQRLLYFMVDSDWSDHDVRLRAARYTLATLTKREPVVNWIVDDSGWLKQGKHSVAVRRQYTGSAGKIINCQTRVSLTLAARSEHLPVDFELYLPHCWADDPARRREARASPTTCSSRPSPSWPAI